MTHDDFEAKTLIQHAARPVVGAAEDYRALLDEIGDSRIVLIGEATHGTHEFYRERARITQQLIIEKGFNAVAAEADWPDSYRVNLFVKGALPGISADAALNGFQRFPTWMWRNRDVLDFVHWLKGYNDERVLWTDKIGFYGLDVYSLYASMNAVIEYLNRIDPEAARQAQIRYGCFERFDQNLQDYGFLAAYGLNQTCEDEVVSQLMELRSHAWEYAHRARAEEREAFFSAEMNAIVAKNAERYYRCMFKSRVDSWNLRDTHMFETLNRVIDHIGHYQETPKVVVWAHNSHVGDARATEMGATGELNIGQLVRQKYREAAYNIGFSTYTGSVTAASDWDAPAQRKQVLRALPGSYELLFAKAEIPAFYIQLRQDRQLRETLGKLRLERAIGVIYAPQTERQSHYFHADLSNQFDAMIHINETQAVEPLEITAHWQAEVPETFPSAF